MSTVGHVLRRHASCALLGTPMRESPRSRCVSIANDHHNVNPSSRRLLAHRGDGDGRLATLWGPFGDPCCIGPWASWWPIIAPLASLDVRWTIWDTNQLAANRYIRSMMRHGAGGGPGGGARVRLARGSRVLRIPASIAGLVPTRRDIFRIDLSWFVIWGLCRGAGGGPGGGAGVRLARGSRVLRIPPSIAG